MIGPFRKLPRVEGAGLLALAAMLVAAAPPVLVPPPGSTERTAVLDALRPEDWHGPKVRFVVHSLRIVQGRDARFAYASVEPSKGEFDGGRYILERGRHWRVIWSVVGGGSNTCADLAAYHLAVLRHLEARGADPDALAPGLRDEHRQLAACDPDDSEVGDMGPAL